MSKNSPIGFFDSGVGGTSIWKEMIKLLPNEDTIYLADSANAPYGKKSKEQIISFSEKNVNFLLDQGCKMIVVACNTATTNAISFLRKKYDIPFIGIEPAIKPAALLTKTNSVGILATQGTLSSDLFVETSNRFAADIDVFEQEGKGLVELIEGNNIDSDEMDKLLLRYLEPMKNKHIDYLILGCTHYPYLIPKIKEIVGEKVSIIDSGFAVSRQIKKVLENKNLLNLSKTQGDYQFFTNKNKMVLKNLLKDVRHTLDIKMAKF